MCLQKSEFDRLVEENYRLIETFMLVRGYYGDSYYDAAVDGLLAAARDYCERPETRKYAFSTIAFRKMDDAACAVARKEGRRSEIAQILHLEDPFTTSQVEQNSNMPGPHQDIEDSVTERLMLAQVLSALTEKQIEVFELKRSGYTYNEMAQQCGIGYYGISSRLQRMRNKLRGIRVTMELF